MRTTCIFLAVSALSGALAPSPARADGPDSEWSQPQAPAQAPIDDSPAEASDASFDKRLPPVLPGEDVKDSGKRKRVWSTAGPVPVVGSTNSWEQPPQAPQAPNAGQAPNLGAIDVIIDRTHDDRRHSLKEGAPSDLGSERERELTETSPENQ